MRFDPKSDEEIQTMDLMDEGIYPCQVEHATDKISKSGNEMIELKLRIWDANGRERLIFDYLLPQMAKKLKHFAVNAGLQEKYDNGTILADDCVGKTMAVELFVQLGKPKPDGSGDYPAKNSVRDYCGSSSSSAPKETEKSVDNSHPSFDDDIPF